MHGRMHVNPHIHSHTLIKLVWRSDEGPSGQYFQCNNKRKACLWPSQSKYLALGQLYYSSPVEYVGADLFSNEPKTVKTVEKEKQLRHLQGLENLANISKMHLCHAAVVVSLGGLGCDGTWQMWLIPITGVGRNKVPPVGDDRLV